MPSSSRYPDVQPIIRWAGSKRRLLKQIISLLPKSFGTYYEPFFGSGCLFFSLNPERAVLNDLNIELINFYRAARRQPLEILRAVRRIRRTRLNYYRIRSRYARAQDALDKAKAFYFLNRLCFNGIYRTNAAGEFNVPIGTRTGALPDESEFLSAVCALRRARLMATDFETAVNSASRGDFVYLDPPYVYKHRKDRGEYGRGSFTVTDIQRLKTTLSGLDKRGVKFLVSYLDCDEAKILAKNLNVSRVSVNRSIASLSLARTSVDEVLIRNYR